MDEGKCNSMYANLLMFGFNVPATAYIREFSELTKCDDIFDMTLLREYIGDKDRMHRILNFNETKKDVAVATSAVLRCRDLHKDKLLEVVTWPTWLYYNTIHRVERVLRKNR